MTLSGIFEGILASFLFLVVCSLLERSLMPIGDFYRTIRNSPKRLINTLRRTKKGPDTLPKELKQAIDFPAEFFMHRFQDAFPGVREPTSFNRRKSAQRLSILLRPPISYKTNQQAVHPIWWWRGSASLHIEEFRREHVLSFIHRSPIIRINSERYKISEIIAVPNGSSQRSFVYVSTLPMKPTGVQHDTTKQQLRYSSYANEEFGEYGLFGLGRVSRQEFDDGAAVRWGKPRALPADRRLRVIYLTKYNFLLAPHNTVFNNTAIDDDISRLMDAALHNDDIDGLVSLATTLPNLRRED